MSNLVIRFCKGCAVAGASLVFLPALALESYIPAEGLQFHLDAADVTSLTVDESTARISEWRSDAGTIKFTGWSYQQPHYVKDAFGAGLNGVLFGYEDDLTSEIATDGSRYQFVSSSSATTNRTVVYVMKTLKSVSCMEYFGPVGVDYGLRLNGTGGSHYRDGFNVDGWGYVNGYNWLTPAGGADYPTAGSAACFDTQVCVDVRPDAATDIELKRLNPGVSPAVFSTGTVFKVGIGWYDGIGGATYGKRFYRGYFGEVLAYNRRLSDNERNYLTAKLIEKWRPEDICRWIGGEQGVWNEPGNWQDKKVPTTTSTVILSGLNLTLSDSPVAGILVLENSHLTLADGATMSVGAVCGPSGDTSSIVLSGKLVMDVAEGKSVGLCGRLTGVGPVIKTGKGTLSFGNDDVLNGQAVELVAGTLDLNATQQTFGGITTSYGTIVNSLGAEATMVFAPGAGEKVSLGGAVHGNVRIVKNGAGSLSVSAFQENAGATVLNGGTLVADNAYLTPDLLADVSIHADASRPDTIVEEDGFVKDWMDASGRILRTYPVKFTQGTAGSRPYYDATLAGGRGGVVFGEDSEGNVHKSSLNGSPSVSNVTVFIVCTPASVQRTLEVTSGGLPGVFGCQASDNGIRMTGSNGAWKWEGGNGLFTGYASDGQCGQTYLDGKLVMDGKQGITTNVAAKLDQPQLLTAVVAPEKLSQTAARWTAYFGPCIGQYYTTYPRFWTGAIHEIIVFGRYLSTDEFNAVSAGLMKKWGIVPDAACPVENSLSAQSKLVVKGDATLDLSSAPQTAIPEVEFVAKVEGVYPLLTTFGSWTLTDAALALADESGAKPAAQKLVVNSDAGLVGPFKSVTMPQETAVKWSPRFVKVGEAGLMLLLK